MTESEPIRGLGPWRLFCRDVGRALRACRFDPRLPIVVLIVALAAGVPGVVAQESDASWLGLVGTLVFLATLGLLGAERLWFAFADRRERVPRGEIVYASKMLWKRFFGLGVYAFVLFVPFVAIAFAVEAVVGGDTDSRRLVVRITLFVALFVLDIVFTFATPATAFGDLNAGQAVRRSLSIIRSEWPSSAWYTVAPPLALQFLVLSTPEATVGAIPRLAVLVVAALLRLVCVGAVVLFYVDRYVSLEVRPGLNPE